MTNAEKFKEVFGLAIDDNNPDDPCTMVDHNVCNNSYDCESCELQDFWSKEYIRKEKEIN